ncbi:hypothetical protein GDO81_028578 [Engystomops pustulosus]|uniref:Secreted protein n=1 Tax=Engystomops pustulosus TaxID=76066 RepID=A0AAV6YJH1_ENGPU|nr:hypothetical protein GDO81_028578 [Engystomops pustulosus]
MPNSRLALRPVSLPRPLSCTTSELSSEVSVVMGSVTSLWAGVRSSSSSSSSWMKSGGDAFMLLRLTQLRVDTSSSSILFCSFSWLRLVQSLLRCSGSGLQFWSSCPCSAALRS